MSLLPHRPAAPAVVLVALAALVAACSSEPQQDGINPGGGFGNLPDTIGNPGGSGQDAVGAGDAATPTDDAGQTGGGEDADTSGGEDSGGTPDTGPVDAGPQIDGPGCASASGCKGYPDLPYCAIAVQVCVECIVDFHCADTTGNCQDYECVSVSCVPGSAICEGGFLSVCNAAGDGYDKQPCPAEASICVDGQCRVCDPGEVFCDDPDIPGQPSTRLMRCTEDGMDSLLEEQCTGGAVCTAAGCNVCVPGTQSCQGDVALACKGDGSGYEVAQDCAAKGLTCLGGLCVNDCSGDFKSNTNVGCDYWAVDLDNAKVPSGNPGVFYDAANSQFSVIVTNTTDEPALVTVELVDQVGVKHSANFSVAGNALQIMNLPIKGQGQDWGVKPEDHNQNGTSINTRAYRIKSDKPIVAYQFNPLQNFDVFSNDASLLLPAQSLGTEYWVMTRQQTHTDLRSYLTVVATSPGETQVKAWVTVPTDAGAGVPPGPWPQIQQFTLQEGQVLNIQTNGNGADLTGTWIKANKYIAVFGGSEASNAPDTNKCIKQSGQPFGTCQYQGWQCQSNDDCPVTCCADHLEEQLFPVKAWGKEYVLAKTKKRGQEKDIYRILASQNDTVITTSPPIAQVPKLGQGQWFEFETDQDFVLTATHPVLVGQFLASASSPNPNTDTCTGLYLGNPVCKWHFDTKNVPIGCNKNADCPNIPEPGDATIGDPAFMLGVATNQFLEEYLFLAPNKYKENYVTVMAPMNAGITLDGAPIAAENWTVLGGAWQLARVPITEGVHELKADQPVGLQVYGWDDFVSYGYPGGAKLGGE